MQTFLPYADFAESARCLDRQRLGKQRVEVLQLLKAIRDNGGWAKHPAAKMWADNTDALVNYGLAVCEEWMARGYKDTCFAKIAQYKTSHAENTTLPEWLGDADFHASHRSNLLRKLPEHYNRFGWTEPSSLPYVWPRAGNGHQLSDSVMVA